MTDTSSIRSDAIYVRWNVRKAFTYLRRDQDEPIDQLIDKVLSEWLEKNHPNILKHLKEQWDQDKAFREGYKAQPPF